MCSQTVSMLLTTLRSSDGTDAVSFRTSYSDFNDKVIVTFYFFVFSCDYWKMYAEL